jgi:hypothetical protein
MNPGEIKDLIKTLRECGVTHYKTAEIELDLGPEPLKPEPVAIDPDAQHIVHEMKSLLKLSDEDLVDRLFPDKEEKAAEASADNSN